MPTTIDIDQLPQASAINDDDLLILATPDGIAQRITAQLLADYIGLAASGGIEVGRYTEGVGGVTQVDIAALIGKTVLILLRSRMEVEVITSGTPVNDQALFVPSLGRFVFPSGNPLGEDEPLTYIYR